MDAVKNIDDRITQAVQDVSLDKKEDLFDVADKLDALHKELRQYLSCNADSVQTYANKVNEKLCSILFRVVRFLKEADKNTEDPPELTTTGVFVTTDIKLEDKLGKGAYGTAYRAIVCKSPVAVKVPNEDIQLTDEQYNDFLSEINILRHVDCPNVVRFYGACVDRDNIMIVSELMKCDLEHAVKHNMLSEENIICILSDVMHGLWWMHTRFCMIHRDMKPANVLLDENGRGKISDFGFSESLRNGQYILKPGESPKGSPIFMPPEAFQGTPLTVASDVYAFAMIMYFCFSKKMPFEGFERQYPGDIKRAIIAFINDLTGKAIRPNMTGVIMPERMKQLMIACWDQEPTKRPNHTDIIKSLTIAHVEEILRHVDTQAPASAPKNFLDTDNLSVAERFWIDHFCAYRHAESVAYDAFIDAALRTSAASLAFPSSLKTKTTIPIIGDKHTVTLKWYAKMIISHGLWFINEAENKKMNNVINAEWFDGTLTGEKVNVLNEKQDGTYFVRYGTSHAFTVIMKYKGVVEKKRILSSFGGDGHIKYHFEDMPNMFDTLEELIKSRPELLKHAFNTQDAKGFSLYH